MSTKWVAEASAKVPASQVLSTLSGPIGWLLEACVIHCMFGWTNPSRVHVIRWSFAPWNPGVFIGSEPPRSIPVMKFIYIYIHIYIYIYIIYIYISRGILSSLNWFKGKFTGKPTYLIVQKWFHVNLKFPFTQFNRLRRSGQKLRGLQTISPSVCPTKVPSLPSVLDMLFLQTKETWHILMLVKQKKPFPKWP